MSTDRERDGSRLAVAGWALVVVATLTGIVWAAASGGWGITGNADVLLAFAAAITFGEWFRISAPELRDASPIGTASALGLAFTVEIPAGTFVAYGPFVVLAVTALAMGIGAFARGLVGLPVRGAESGARFVAVVVAVVLYRVVHLKQAPGTPAVDDALPAWQDAVLMLAVAVVALLVQALIVATLLRQRRRGAWYQTLVEEIRVSFGLTSAVAVTGVIIALGARPLGLLALPCFLVPLVLTQFAFRRYLAIRATYRQSIRTLSRLTDVAGYTPRGHAERVAALCVRVGRELEMSERDIGDLQTAALVHDIGQVALLEPIPGGATVLAAPADQRRIGDDTLAIIKETGVLDDVAAVLEHQATPFRQVREFGQEIPLGSRVLKLVNAYVDLTQGNDDERSRAAAIERINLGLGYEYDPRIVDVLTAVVTDSTARRAGVPLT